VPSIVWISSLRPWALQPDDWVTPSASIGRVYPMSGKEILLGRAQTQSCAVTQPLTNTIGLTPEVAKLNTFSTCVTGDIVRASSVGNEACVG
jgi:hypothetical protein